MLFRRFLQDERGSASPVDCFFLAGVLLLGSTVGLALMRQTINRELLLPRPAINTNISAESK